MSTSLSSSLILEQNIDKLRETEEKWSSLLTAIPPKRQYNWMNCSRLALRARSGQPLSGKMAHPLATCAWVQLIQTHATDWHYRRLTLATHISSIELLGDCSLQRIGRDCRPLIQLSHSQRKACFETFVSYDHNLKASLLTPISISYSLLISFTQNFIFLPQICPKT